MSRTLTAGAGITVTENAGAGTVTISSGPSVAFLYSGDETSTLQAAIDATPSGGVLDLGEGDITFSAVTIDHPMTLRGRHPAVSRLRPNSGTANSVVVSATAAVFFEDLQFIPTVSRTAGSFVRVDASTGQASFCSFHRVWFANAWRGITFVDHGGFTLRECYFASYKDVGVFVANTVSPDTGDSIITGCTFDAGAESSIAIQQESSGGLKITDSKFLNGTRHYYGLFDGSADTSILLISDNSMEQASVGNIALSAVSPRTFSVVNITDNQITVAASAYGIGLADPGHAFLDNVRIGGNNIQLLNSSNGIVLDRGTNVVLDPNTINGAGTTDVGIVLGANLGPVTIHQQSMIACATEFSGSLPSGSVLRHVSTVTTTDATPTPVGFLSVADESAWLYSARIVGRKSDTTARAAYSRDALLYRDGGGATLQGSVSAPTTIESDSAWDATIGVSSNEVRSIVTGAAATTINWKVSFELVGV